jgi:hypothetical protein
MDAPYASDAMVSPHAGTVALDTAGTGEPVMEISRDHPITLGVQGDSRPNSFVDRNCEMTH